MGIFFWTCGGINDLNVVSLISPLCVTESITLANRPLSDWFIILLCRCLTEISIYIFWKISFWFDYGFKTGITSVDTHDGLKLRCDSIHSKYSSLKHFVVVLYLDKNPHIFQVNFSIRDISDVIFCPLLKKLRAAPRQRLFPPLSVLL